jgi:uncharacterized protein (PEP-CTERM system associated)
LAIAAVVLTETGYAQVPAAPAPAGGGGAADTGGPPLGFGGPDLQPGPAGGGGPAWIITPALQGSETFTDNVLSTAHNRQADLISTLSPSLFITGESARLKGTFDYAPQAIKYLDVTSQDQILQSLFGNGTLTAVPNLLFVDASASISNASRSGGRGFNNAAPIPTSQNTQSIVYTASPYARFHFGDSGDAEVRYSLSQSVFNGNTGATIDTVTGQPLAAISNTTQQVESARYVTGEAFERLQFAFGLSNTTLNSGGGSSLNSRDTVGTVNGTYQVTDAWQALFGGGYESLTFSQQSQNDFRGPTWDIGARYAPRADRTVQLTYGKSQGQNSFNGSAHYAVGGMAVLSASYSETTTTQQQQLFQNLSTATQITPGIIINQTTGLPTFISNPNLALQNSTIRSQNLQAGVTLTGIRNTYSLTLNRTEQSGLTGTSLTQTTTGGVITWSHELSPYTTAALSASYSGTDSGAIAGVPGTNTDASTLGLSFNFALSETLSAAASYAMSYQTGGIGGSVLVDLFTVSLRKNF